MNQNSKDIVSITNQEGTVIEAKPSYAIIKVNYQNYYVSNYHLNLILDQRVRINGNVEILSKNHYFTFQFQTYLNHQRVFKQIKEIEITNQNWHYLRYYFYQTIFNFADHELIHLFLFNIKDKSQNFQSLIQNLNLSHLLNFNSLSIWGLWILITKIPNINNHQNILKVLFSLLWIWWFFLNYSWVLMRFLLKATFKNYKKLKPWSNFASFWVPCLLFPSYVGSNGFWYFTICYLFLKLLKRQRVKISLIGLLLIPLKIYYDFQINLLSPVWDFILAPFLLLINVIVTTTFIFGANPVWLNGLELWLNHLFKIVGWLSYSINIGYQDFFGVFLIYMILILWCSFQWNWKYQLLWLILVGSIYLIIWLMKPSHHLEMLNVGNGNSFIYFNKYKNLTVLFDCGVGKGFSKQLPSQYLKYLGINKIDAIFISHNHEDHFNALENLQMKFYVKNVYYRIGNFDELIIKNLTIKIFNNSLAKSENNKSLVIIVDFANTRLLFTGDIERVTENYLMTNSEFLNYLRLRRLDILQVAHHGSKTSSNYDFIKLLNPRMGLISGMYYQRLKFPDQQTLNTFKSLNIVYYITEGFKNVRINFSSGLVKVL
ncbi:MBL fold metallo-hydrolase [Mesoplasma syrphidae]|uniref:MBL fold metallo-hydrolase n=1 Tax=Mesoplasma syrphidae TaxID=225999 RepID=UPI0012FEBBB7|nr:MBL fold metallo-hydrolase [Mesoplasma syrphidae]